MKLLNILCIVIVSTLSSYGHVEASCISIETVNPDEFMWVVAKEIKQSGEYCLTHSITTPRRSSFSEGERSYDGSGVLTIRASNIVIDFHEFTLNADTKGMGGVSSSYWKKTLGNQNITIRNGTLKSRTRSGIDFNRPNGSIFTDFYYLVGGVTKEELLESQKRDLRETLEILPKSADAYQKTEHLIERMKIESKIVTIGMKGASNIIRNSTIEITDGHAAIYLFGPNQLIENNIIIFKGKAAVESAAAIKLHQADGTIIRNNDIIIESMGDEAPKAAISLIDSKDVVIENNRIYGINTLVKNWDEKSCGIEKNNEFRSLFRRPLTIGEPGVH